MNDLLAPRYKVIATWPSLGDDVEVGFIYEKCTEYMCKHMDKYPHLFRKLEWWEERKPEEIPLYVNYQNSIYKITYLSEGGSIKCETVNGRKLDAHLTYTLPATKEEYLSQNKNHE